MGAILLLALTAMAWADEEPPAATPAAVVADTPAYPALDLQALITAAVAAGEHRVTIAPGTYRIPGTVRLTGLRDFTVEGGGATLLWPAPKRALEISDCHQLALRHFTLDYAPLATSQGTVLAVDPVQGEMTVKLHDGYPALGRERDLFVHVFTAATRQWKLPAPDLHASVVAHLPDGTLRLHLANLPTPYRAEYLEAGDLVAFDWRGDCAISLRQGSSDLLFEDVAIQSSPGCAVVATFCGTGHVYRRFTIGRGPRPPGASEERLLSTAADGLHYSACRQGPTVEQCDFAYMGDDSVNCHGALLPVLAQPSPTTLLLLRPYPQEAFGDVVAAGQEARLLAAGNFAPLASGKLVSMVRTPGPPVAPADLKRYWPALGMAGGNAQPSYFLLTLEQPVAAPPECWVDLPDCASPNFVIRDSYFHDHRARALRLEASGGLVENNRFARLKQNAISVGGEYGFWRESGWVHGITIRHNQIREVCQDYVSTSPACYAPGAIAVFVRLENSRAELVPGHDHLVITDNDISGSLLPGIALSAVDGATVTGNRIRAVRGPAIRVGAACRNVVSTPNDLDPPGAPAP